ncbi:MAG: ABC transporter ATP-binding protein [Candidatus Krumholzibacteriia bacterium]
MSAPNLLAVDELEVAFGAARAVRGVSFTLARGGTLALAGESGCGKTLTIRALLGLLPRGARARGRVTWEGTELLALPERARRAFRGRRLGLVPQEPAAALNPVLSVGAQVAEALRWHHGLGRRAAWAGALRLLAEVRLPDAAARAADFPHRLSGGMRQRALLAAALACEPECLLADEPTAALDVTVQAQILDLLRGLVRARGMSLLFITHDLALAPGLTERIAIMYAGRIVEEGPTVAVLAAPAHPYTRALTASLPERWPAHGPLPELRGAPPAPGDETPGCAFAPRCAHARAACRGDTPPLTAVGPGRRAACLPVVAGALARGEAPS